MMRAVPVSGKKKSADICAAFVRGARNAEAGASVFYGVDASNVKDFWRVRSSGAPWYYIDNSYFDCVRGSHFRVTKNAIQHCGAGQTSGERLRRLGVKCKPWREDGEQVVICPQSQDFMERVITDDPEWLKETLSALRTFTDRELRVREWNRDKIAAAATLGEDLRNAWALVTHSSAAAITALIEGVPVFSKSGAAAHMSGLLREIESPFLPDGREQFLGVLADNQWTIDEIESGMAWKALNP
jgi:hypothetical protein